LQLGACCLAPAKEAHAHYIYLLLDFYDSLTKNKHLVRFIPSKFRRTDKQASK
jgi:hypothetical protein